MRDKIVYLIILLNFCIFLNSFSSAQPPPPPFSMRPTPGVEQGQEAKKEKININTADVEELERLPGVGPVISKRLIEYRQKNGNFKDIKDIMKVKGIGKKKYQKIKDMITI